MSDDDLRDAAALAILPTTLQMNITTLPALAGAAPKHNVNLANAAFMAFEVGEMMVKARAERTRAAQNAAVAN